jgi:SAM-dependent methyltransferase
VASIIHPALLSLFLIISPVLLPVRAQTQSGAQAVEVQIYEKFRAWVTKQPPGSEQADLIAQYREVLAREGSSAPEIDRQVRVITEHGQRLEIERWNRILTAPAPAFNTEPNAFLVEMTRGIKPGRALDVGMGQGRNALYLARQGWAVTGFDPAEKAVAVAQEQAKQLGVKLTAVVVGDDQFDFGKAQWDLIVLSYVSLRHLVPRINDALKPGGLVVVEGFHRDATKTASIGGGVVFDTNELLRLFEHLRVVRYEDTNGTGDFGKQATRLVRFAAQKP